MVTLKQAVEYALQFEQRSKDIYGRWAKGTGDPHLRKLFKNLQSFEKKHVLMLKSIDLRGEIGTQVTSFEPVDLSKEVMMEPSSKVKDIRRVLMWAAKKEKIAKDRYLGISKKVKDPKLKDLFLRLSNEEEYHMLIIDQQMRRMTESF